MENNQFNYFRNINRPLLIWGTGSFGKRLYTLLKKASVTVSGFVDSNQNRYGTYLEGLPVYNPTYLWNNIAHPYIIIGSSYIDEITNQLEKLGYKKYIDFNDTLAIPLTYIIEIVGMCNLQCPSCPRGNSNDLTSPKGFMDLNLFNEIVKKIVQESLNIASIDLFNWGEPFLHPKLAEIISIVKQNNIQCRISTNFNKANSLEEILEAHPDEMVISISGSSQDIYSSTHKGGNVHTVKSNMWKLRSLLDKLKINMKINVSYHLYKNNMGQDYQDIKMLCQELEFGFAPKLAHLMPVEKLIDFYENRIPKQVQEIVDLLVIHPTELNKLLQKYKDEDCSLRKTHIAINCDGSVSLCCASFDETNIIANNFLTVSLEEIQKLKYNHQLCDKCMKCMADKICTYRANEELMSIMVKYIGDE